MSYDDDDYDDEVVGEHMQVIGDDGEVYEIVGDVMGDEDDDDDVGARRRRRGRKRGRSRGVRVRKASWRKTQLAPGVQTPGEGMIPLPLTGQQNGGIFTDTNNSITFEGQVQKPFRGERLLVSTVRTGVTATGRLIAQLFVGTDLQQGDVPGFDLEQVGDPQAFGVRMSMVPATPGVFIRVLANLNIPLTTPDTIVTTVTLLGRYIR